MSAVTIVLALSSMLLFLALVFEDLGEIADADWSNLPIGLIVRYLIAMGLGGALAGHILSGLFGRTGFLGWLLAIFGGVVTATFAGMVGSAIGLAPDLFLDGFQTRDFVAIGAGALVFPLALIGWPVLLPIWTALVSTAHILARRRR
ncbi:hypothetical protein C1J03_03810 [Sulfitobacter sp. SK012]|uniref:hypothetical protein n=1 Tax=Sulfitobacter sp. SK012 TaxID=1389005 RepID=UPI000E0B2E66|nr:hypothetical protein [Sulfitobacter sp. SK012]AXI45237.1 hypothetical protein C1J03_03810 [Sulfitobacter sp. SK012]